MSAKVITYTPVDDEDAMGIIGEGIHTGLRKGSQAPEAHDLWVAISNSEQAWDDALSYCLWGLGQMGYAICESS